MEEEAKPKDVVEYLQENSEEWQGEIVEKIAAKLAEEEAELDDKVVEEFIRDDSPFSEQVASIAVKELSESEKDQFTSKVAAEFFKEEHSDNLGMATMTTSAVKIPKLHHLISWIFNS